MGVQKKWVSLTYFGINLNMFGTPCLRLMLLNYISWELGLNVTLFFIYLGHRSRLLIATIFYIKAVVVSIILQQRIFSLASVKMRVRHPGFFKVTIPHIPYLIAETYSMIGGCAVCGHLNMTK